MTFDQISRYRACAEIIQKISNSGAILDVGSGPQRILGNILSDRDITYVDPLLANIQTPDNKSIAGDIFDPKLNLQKFDCVCSVDTLEHVPAISRNRFLKRISDLATKNIVIGFPCTDGNVALETDLVIDRAFRKVFGMPYCWIEEHLKFGLPNREEVIKQLKELGWCISLVGHGHAPWLKMLLSIVVVGWEIPEAHADILRFSRKFIEDLYRFDYNPPYYRWYVVASKEPAASITLDFGTPIDVSANDAFSKIYTDALYSIISIIISKNASVMNSINSNRKINEIAVWSKALEAELEESKKKIEESKKKIEESKKKIEEYEKHVEEYEKRKKESEKLFYEIFNSKAWKFITILRRVRFWLIPAYSIREHAAKFLYNKLFNGLSKGSQIRSLLQKAIRYYIANGIHKTIATIINRIRIQRKAEVLSYRHLHSKFAGQIIIHDGTRNNSESITKNVEFSARVAFTRIINRLGIACDHEKVIYIIKDSINRNRYFLLLDDLFAIDKLIFHSNYSHSCSLIKTTELLKETYPRRRRRILFITAQTPSPYHGGGNRVINFIKILSENNEIYVCTSFIEGEDEPMVQALEPYCQSILKIPHYQFGGNQNLIRKWLNNVHIDIVHYEWPHSLSNYDKAFGKYHVFTYMEAVTLRLLMELEFQKAYSEKWINTFVMLLNILRIELVDAAPLSARIAVTEKDANFFKEIFPYQEYTILNHGLCFDEFIIPDIEPEPYTLIFIGNYEHPPNEDAMEYFFNSIWDDICKEIPEVKIYLVGANPTKNLLRYADGKRVIVTGKVPDVRPYIQKATFCIAPLISGAGLRGKVIEYAALSRTFVATTIATTDLLFRNGIDYLCADNHLDFSQNVIKLLRNKSMRTQMAANAFKTARQNYDTRYFIGLLNRLYERMDNDLNEKTKSFS